jgi:ankyrin repeat protein
VKFLVEKGANAVDHALLQASESGHIGVMRFSIENGADVNASDEFYGNALRATSYRGQFKIVEHLVKNGADINAQGSSCPGTTVLEVALHGSCDDIMQYFI